jgi:hypothetical protein
MRPHQASKLTGFSVEAGQANKAADATAERRGFVDDFAGTRVSVSMRKEPSVAAGL